LEALLRHSDSSVFRDGVHHFVSELPTEGSGQIVLKLVKSALEGSAASLEAPIAAGKALCQLKPKS
jgi:hypothetical protein